MRVIVYKLLKKKIEKKNLLDYGLNDPDTAEVVWQSYADESENEDYPSVNVGILPIIAKHESGDLFLISEIPEVIKSLSLPPEADVYSKWWPRDMEVEEKEKVYYLLDNLKAARSLLKEVYEVFKDQNENLLLKLWE